MSGASRILLLVFCPLLAILAGCDGPAVTISASHLEKDSSGKIAIGSTGSMTSNKVGALIGVGGSSAELLTVRIAEIGDERVVLDISHPRFEDKQIDIRLAESKDVFFGDGAFGARIQFSAAK